MKKSVRIALCAVFAVIFIASAAMLLKQQLEARRSAAEFDALAHLVAKPAQAEAPGDTPAAPAAPPAPALTAAETYAPLYAQNADLIGWISIDDTPLNYPVMQTPDDPDYYLKHSFEKEYSDYGVPYADAACTPDACDNMILYGHNRKDESMFGSLLGYTEKSYYDAHPLIRFDTLHGFATYQIVAVFSYDDNGEDFRVGEYVHMSEGTFQCFAEELTKRRAYDTGVTIDYSDTLLTLSTCEYTHENGRFIVVAKKLHEA